ncbi:hypothetical protein V5799_026047 [Amblyomma americanum]|uniref:Uncharacterized protein n=1 Tax=Amblyomma americanum TaxID=6943 RepID=A0AAQ4DJP3_AMBAM
MKTLWITILLLALLGCLFSETLADVTALESEAVTVTTSPEPSYRLLGRAGCPSFRSCRNRCYRRGPYQSGRCIGIRKLTCMCTLRARNTG